MHATNKLARPSRRSIRVASSVPRDRPHGGRGHQQPEPDRVEPERTRRHDVEDEDPEDGHRAEVHRPDDERHRPQQPMMHEVVKAVADLRADRRRRHRPLGAERAAQVQQADQCAEVAGGRRPERRCDPDGREEAADRRSDELVHRQLDRVEAAVRSHDLVLADHVRQHRARGGVEHRLEAAQHEGDDVEQPDRRNSGEDRDGQAGQQDRPTGIDEDHRPPPIEAIGQGAGDERKHQPRQPRRDGDAGDEARLLGQADREQGQGDREDAVRQVREERRREQRPEPAPEPPARVSQQGRHRRGG
jgi:hypothetical protein